MHANNKFKLAKLNSYLANKGIIFRYSASYTPKQNSAIEIRNKILLNKVRALLINSSLNNKL